MRKHLSIYLCIILILLEYIPLCNIYAGVVNDNQDVKNITYLADDITVIPDKYNTGAKGELIDYEACTGDEKKEAADGIEIIGGYSEKDKKYSDYRINLSKLPARDGNFIIRNVDFSKAAFYYTNTNAKRYTIRFENCKFKSFRGSDVVKTELVSCSMESLSASNMVCDKCQIGHTYNDGIRAFNDVWMNNCYIVDLQYPFYSSDPRASQHIDGLQVFGNLYNRDKKETKGKDAGNVHFYNCRFEIPTYYIDGDNKAGMNDCIMLQPEYSNAYHYTFENIITNGANYQFSAHRGYDKTLSTSENTIVRDLGDVSLKNCRMGEGSIGGIMTAVDNYVKLENVGISTTLYVGSTWKDEEGFTHISVTNDSVNERILTIVTDKEIKSETIPAYPLADITNVKSAENEHKYSFADYPIDLDLKVAADQYVICYDTTFLPKQIRFVNYADKPVLIDESVLSDYCREITTVRAGKCGKKGSEVYYNLTNDGVLTISGNGAMADYHSKDLPPWDRQNEDDKLTAAKPKPYIRKVVIEEGVTSIGGQAFNHRGTIQEVELASTVESIGGRAFAGCSSILSLTLPASIKSLGKDALANTFAIRITYLGDDFSNVNGGKDIAYKVIGTKEYEELNGTPGGNDGGIQKDPTKDNDVNKDILDKDDIGKKDETSNPIAVNQKMQVSLSYQKTTYSGKAKKPSVKVFDSNKQPVDAQYYSVSYQNNKRVGTATVSLQFTGAYSGKLEATFDILPPKTKVTKVSSGNKSMSVTLKKVKSQISGYEIRVATDKKFKKNVKKISFAKNKSLKRTLKGLKSKKRYFIKARTFTKKNGKKYYSTWSTYSKKVTTK